MEIKKEYNKNKNGSYSIKENQKIDSDDGFVLEEDIRPVGRSMEEDRKAHYVKGKSDYVHYETNNPIITRYATKIFAIIFMIVGVVTFLSSKFFAAKIIGVIFVITSIVVYKSLNEQIDEIEEKLKESDEYVQYTKEEEKEILKEAKEEIFESAKSVSKEILSSEKTKEFGKKSFPIMMTIVVILSLIMFFAISKLLGVVIFIIGSVCAIIYCFVFLKFISKFFDKH